MPLRAPLLALALVTLATACSENVTLPPLEEEPPPFAFSQYLAKGKLKPNADVLLVRRPKHLEHFEKTARQRGMENTLVLATVNVLLTRGMLRSALGNAATAETRAAALNVPKGRFPKEKPSSTQKCPQGNCTPATKEEILKDAKPGKVSSSRQYEKTGGIDQANKDFDAMTQGAKVQDRGGGIRTAELPDGSKVIVRPVSSGPQPKPTLEIQPLSGRTIKIRYE